ncbi:MAG TPA: SDR family NAD(P)-dependent oxidoreductase [Steroidobacteraceae bacterium]|nr:SDR family NAD(P)-dependent oxidoreductase [Steroidobacteraceae bacterium]
MGQLQNRVCVITGGGGSIGFASAQVFLAEGARVLLVDIAADSLERCVAKLLESGVARDRVASRVADVGSTADTVAYLSAAVERWGRIDVLFSNAGNSGAICPIADFPEEVFDEVLRVHVRGAFLACKHGLPRMNDGGSIIITSSVVGLRGDPGPYAYITAKHAQVGLMRSVAKEAAMRRIRVNTIHPGPTRNPFQTEIETRLSAILGRDAGAFFDELIPLRRHAAPEEIARTVLFLASDQSSYVTGTTLAVDGGMTA